MASRLADALAAPQGLLNFVADHPFLATAGALGAYGVARAAASAYDFLRIDGPVDYNSERHGGELVAEVLKAHGVKYVFTLVGGHVSPILVACERSGIRVIDTRHEVTTVFAADAVARLSGVPGVAVVTAGPGLTNTVTAVKNAQMAESPLLLIGGAAATILKGRGALQDIDQMSLFKPLCKFTATITRVSDIVPTLRKALRAAQSGKPGPVFVEMPIDTLYPIAPVVREFAKDVGGKGGIGAKVVSWYLNHHIRRLFGGAFLPRDVSPLPVNIPMATNAQVAVTAHLVRQAKKPVILVGSQATLPPTPADALATALTSLGIPCFLGGMARGLLGKESAVQVRQQRRQALKEADLIILAGAVCDFRLEYGRAFNRRAKIISVNRDKAAATMNSDLFWKPTVTVAGDPGTFVADLARSLRGTYKAPEDWVAALKQRDAEKESANMSKAADKLGNHHNPIALLARLDAVLDNDAILVADGGDFVGTAAYVVRPRGPLQWLDPGAFGTLGVGGGFALGAKLCRPNSDVWILYGDGSCGYSVAEFDTYARHKTPVIALVGNDACWSQIAREQVPMFKTDVACALLYTDYHAVAEGFGGRGIVLKGAESQAEVDAALRRAVELSRGQKGLPVLVNALIGKTDFREGSISV